MHHGVDAGRGGDMRRQAQRQLRIEDGPVRDRRRGETTPFFSVVGVVTMAIGVTSEPVPAVVGASSSGRRLPLARPTP